MNTIEKFFGNQFSNTGRWLKKQHGITPTAVEELAELAQVNDYRTIGELITDKKKAAKLINAFLKSGCILESEENITVMSAADLQKKLEYALRYREGQLLNFTKEVKEVVVEKTEQQVPLRDQWEEAAAAFRFTNVDAYVAQQCYRR